jgi:5-formyltetrahydrofolate cyclo-ligase
MEAGELDMIFVPLLAFDTRGYRVGYGKGFYDKYLAGCSNDCIKVGFSYFGPVSSIDDHHEFDVPLDLCITPQNIYVF